MNKILNHIICNIIMRLTDQLLYRFFILADNSSEKLISSKYCYEILRSIKSFNLTIDEGSQSFQTKASNMAKTVSSHKFIIHKCHSYTPIASHSHLPFTLYSHSTFTFHS